jgi:endonuclease-3
MATIAFSKLVDKLQQHYGAPAPPPSTDPLELIIWENIAYLASDKRRAEAFAILKRTIGTRPDQILAAQHSALAAIGKAGILPDVSAEKLLTIAKIAHEEFQSDLGSVLRKPLPQAKEALKRFPSIGDPGAVATHSGTLSARCSELWAVCSTLARAGLRGHLCHSGTGTKATPQTSPLRGLREAGLRA